METKLEQTHPDYFSEYSTVTFREDLLYSFARARGGAQDKLLMRICADAASSDEMDTDAVMQLVRQMEV